MHRRLPAATMCETVAAANRSLYDAVGDTKSNLNHRFVSPACDPICRDLTKGVFPSPNVTRACSGTKSIQSAYCQILMALSQVELDFRWFAKHLPPIIGDIG